MGGEKLDSLHTERLVQNCYNLHFTSMHVITLSSVTVVTLWQWDKRPLVRLVNTRCCDRLPWHREYRSIIYQDRLVCFESISLHKSTNGLYIHVQILRLTITIKLKISKNCIRLMLWNYTVDCILVYIVKWRLVSNYSSAGH